jgi:hypothetical protein
MEEAEVANRRGRRCHDNCHCQNRDREKAMAAGVEELRVGSTCSLHSLYTESPMGGGAGRIDTVTPHANERRQHG